MLQRLIRAPFDHRIVGCIRVFFRNRVDTSLDVLALRQQVAVLKRKRLRHSLNRVRSENRTFAALGQSKSSLNDSVQMLAAQSGRMEGSEPGEMPYSQIIRTH